MAAPPVENNAAAARMESWDFRTVARAGILVQSLR
jgi:hypothetical protein